MAASGAAMRRQPGPTSTLPPGNRWRAIARAWPEYVCIAPFFILFAIFFAWPVVWSLVLSFQQWDGVSAPRWVGWNNYQFVAGDLLTHKMAFNTLRFLLILVPLGVILPVMFGALLELPGLRGRSFFRTALFVPAVTSLVIVGIVWRLIFGSANGWLNGLLAGAGLGPYDWLKQEWLAQIPVVTLTIWGGLGFSILIVLGGLQGIDPEIYDAARVDGASGWQSFWQITLPMLRPVLVFLLISSTIGAMTMFAQPYVVTRGGPANATLTPLLYIYNIGIGSTGAARIGDAAALSFLLTAATLVVVFAQLFVLRRRGGDGV